MKTKLFLTAFFLLTITQKGFTQYAPFLNNSSWNITVYSFMGAQSYVINSGTNVVIGSYTYRKITEPVFSTDVYIREDVVAKKVYTRKNNIDELLYDFSLPISGTFVTPTGGVYTVQSITTVNVNGGTRRKFRLDNGFFGFNWIEGVGNPNHPLVPSYELPSDPAIVLSCSAQNGLAVYNQGLANGSTPTDCSALGLEQNYLERNIIFSPNPFNTEIHISSVMSLDTISLELFNSLGQLVKEVKNISGNNFTLNRDSLNNGLYFLQVVSKDNKIMTYKKIIIQD